MFRLMYVCDCRVLYPYKKQSIPKGHDVLLRSVESKHDANVNSSRKSTYLTYRRAECYGHQKAITHLAVIHEVCELICLLVCLYNCVSFHWWLAGSCDHVVLMSYALGQGTYCALLQYLDQVYIL